MLVISPHLDDAVFGCGCLLAQSPGSTVVTVFAGAPGDPGVLTEWDARCGFASAEAAMVARRREDATALALLEAAPTWLQFCDSQYRQTPSVNAVAQALHDAIAPHAAGTVLVPLGLFHSDHLLAHDAAVMALTRMGASHCLAYEDALYRGMRGELQARLYNLAARGVIVTPQRLGAPSLQPRKDRAVRAYTSQMRAFGPNGVDDTAQPERFWRLEMPR